MMCTLRTTYVSSLIFFSATVRPDDFTLALYTTPYVPSPIFSNLSKESILSSSPAAITLCVCVCMCVCPCVYAYSYGAILHGTFSLVLQHTYTHTCSTTRQDTKSTLLLRALFLGCTAIPAHTPSTQTHKLYRYIVSMDVLAC